MSQIVEEAISEPAAIGADAMDTGEVGDADAEEEEEEPPPPPRVTLSAAREAASTLTTFLEGHSEAFDEKVLQGMLKLCNKLEKELVYTGILFATHQQDIRSFFRVPVQDVNEAEPVVTDSLAA